MSDVPAAAPTYPRTADAGAAMRYFAWLYSRAPQQSVLQMLIAIEAEVASSLRAGLDHTVAHFRLQWWAQEFERLMAGQPAHPLTHALARTLPAAIDLKGLVDTASWDLAAATFQTRKELALYCERWSSAMIEPLAGPAAGPLAAALCETEMLLNLHRDAHYGRLRLPLDELERAGLHPASLTQTPWAPALVDLLRARFRVLREQLANGAGTVRGLVVWCALAQRYLRRADRALPVPLAAGRFEPFAQSWRAWRAARSMAETPA